MKYQQPIRNDKEYGEILNNNIPSCVDYAENACYRIQDTYVSFHSYTDASSKLQNAIQAEVSIYNAGERISRGMIRKVLTLFFNQKEYTYTRLTALVSPDNLQAVKLARVCRFTEEGKLREVYNGEDRIVFSILRREFEELWAESLVHQKHHHHQIQLVQ